MLKKEEEPIVLEQFQPPAKEHETTFIAMLFIIEHFFLGLFICIRYIVSRQECDADIFLKRRDYKRRIKKNLPKDILALHMGGNLIGKWLTHKESMKEDKNDEKTTFE